LPVCGAPEKILDKALHIAHPKKTLIYGFQAPMDPLSKPATFAPPSPFDPNGAITAWLRLLPEGDSVAMSRVMNALYGDLKKIARRRMRDERADHTLAPEALISEFFLRLGQNAKIRFENRGHFLAVATQQMRRILVDYARAHRAQKRNGGMEKVAIEDYDHAIRQDPDKVLIVDELIERLRAQEPRMAQVVEMRCFGGLTHAEIAEALEVDERTSKRDWNFARAWLECEIRRYPNHGHDG
jgi:RNA polymerase sigma factor (TIGR02999 family)